MTINNILIGLGAGILTGIVLCYICLPIAICLGIYGELKLEDFKKVYYLLFW